MGTEIKVKAPKVSKQWEGVYDFGDNLDEAVAKFGADVVFSGFVSDARIAAQSIAREALEKGKEAEEIATILDAWKPGVSRMRASDPLAAITSKFAKMSQEEKIAFLQKLSGLAQAPAAE